MDFDSILTNVMNETTGEVYADAAHDGPVTSHECYSQHQILQAQAEQEAQAAAAAATAAQDAWQSQTFQVYECNFDNTSNGSDKGIVKAFSTGTLFNTTVGESRTQMGIQGDNLKMTNGGENNFFKALKWSPDGSCLLSSSNDSCMRIFALPDLKAESKHTPLTPGVLIREGEVIYDMCWYPGMTSADPATCCVLSSSRDHPVHLWDAFTGELRCSYTLVDHCEVNFAPNALCFNLDGSKIYCGSNNMIQIFDTTRPGKDCQKKPTVPTRKSKKGQKGVISCLAFNPDHSDLYAAGSFLKSIGLYDSRADELLLLLRDKKQRANGRREKPSPVIAANEDGAASDQKDGNGAISSTPMGGLTQVQFSPDGQYLYSASRQDPFIRCWDIRNTANVLFRLERPGDLTNQRLGFDVSSDGRWLSTGDMNGDITIFDLSNCTDPDAERLVTRICGHNDVISSAVFHPTGSVLATSSGQRKYELSGANDTDSDSDSNSNDEFQNKLDQATMSVQGKDFEPTVIDNSISLWTLPGDYIWYVNGQRWSDPSAQEDTTTNGESEAVVDSTMALDERINSSSTPSGDVVMESTSTTTATS
ncbi:Telomerase Cajal body protein 1 [Linnemannia gamsii]|uniref:Telomerase Cajal body protein 1 n=1 Tax=Linnemannia gamsii TaxID=64522 RepID=A0ABQ7JWF0_9FUNG|nr:Telomerase Cajal body protein 1 [Linnemannia gamsii]